MAITRASFLHYWSARHGVLPLVGGRPGFSRNSAGTAVDGRGELLSAIINTPRWTFETDKATAANERRAALLIEQARTNNITSPSDWRNAAWVATNVTVSYGALDPMGGATASTLTAAAAGGTITQTLAAGSSIQRANTVWMRRRTGTGFVNVLRFDGSGYDTVTLTGAWARVAPALPLASTARAIGVQFATSGDAVDVWVAQQEDSPYPSSEILSASTRAVDSLYWNFPQVPQAMMIFHRCIYQPDGSTATLWSMTSAAGAAPIFLVYAPASAGYVAYHAEGVNVVTSAAPQPAAGDTLDTVALFAANGSARLIQSINGAAVLDNGPTAGLTFGAAFADTRLWLGANGQVAGYTGLSRHLDLKVVKYADVVATSAQGIMDELRGAELDPNQNQI